MDMTSILKAAGPWGPILAGFVFLLYLVGLGFITLAGLWVRRELRSLFNGKTETGNKSEDHQAILAHVIEQNQTCKECMTKVIGGNTEAMIKVADALRENGEKLDRNHRDMQDNLTTMHRRLDEALVRRAA